MRKIITDHNGVQWIEHGDNYAIYEPFKGDIREVLINAMKQDSRKLFRIAKILNGEALTQTGE